MKTLSLLTIALLQFTASNVSANDEWRALDPQHVLVIETSKGMIYVELKPEFAPKSVERVKLLSREKIYDGLQFHRVISNFVAQTGNPNNKDGGKTSHPNLMPEMMFKISPDAQITWATQGMDASSGWLGSVPFQATPYKSGQNTPIRAWGAHCAGGMGMGRGEARDSANSEIYFMLAPHRRLDRDYTIVGQIIYGFEVVQKLAVGEPPHTPDVMQKVSILSDWPKEKQPSLSLLSGASLQKLIQAKRLEKGADFSVCDLQIPVNFSIQAQ